MKFQKMVRKMGYKVQKKQAFILPDHLWENVLSYLKPKTKGSRFTRLHAMLVCKNWLNLCRKVLYKSSLMYACLTLKKSVVMYLLEDKRTDPTEFENIALRAACYYGWEDIVEYLLKDKRVNLVCNNTNDFLSYACENNHLAVVKALLKDPRIDPTANQYRAVNLAKNNNHSMILSELQKHPKLKSININGVYQYVLPDVFFAYYGKKLK